MISNALFDALPFDEQQDMVADLINKAVTDAKNDVIRTSGLLPDMPGTFVAVAAMSTIYSALLASLDHSLGKAEANEGDKNIAKVVLAMHEKHIEPLAAKVRDTVGEVPSDLLEMFTEGAEHMFSWDGGPPR